MKWEKLGELLLLCRNPNIVDCRCDHVCMCVCMLFQFYADGLINTLRTV